MSNVPLPEPAFSLRWERGEHKVSPPMDDCDCYTADQMHAYAASVSAAKDAEISRLKHRIALHDPCNGRMAGEPPRYTPECVVLRAEVAGLRKALAAAIRQNEHDMLMTGEELRAARAALGDKTPTTPLPSPSPRS